MTRRLVLVALATAFVARPVPVAAQGIGLEQLKHMMSWQPTSLILVDELELAVGAEGRPVDLQALGWYGGAYNRLWFRAEGEQSTTTSDGYIEGHLYYGRLVSPFWDAVVGTRVDGQWGNGGDARAHLAVGLIGLAPLRFEVSPTLFVSQKGDVSFRLRAEYALLVTQRIALDPEVEVNAAVQEAEKWNVGAGINDLELSARLRYIIVREFSPYVGILWVRRFGATADLAEQDGEPVSELAVVLGVRVWR